MTPGEVLAYVTGVGGLGISLYTLFSKGRESAWTQAAALRGELQGQIDDLREREQVKEREIAELRTRLSGVEGQLGTLSQDQRTLLDFLRDIRSGQFELSWIRARADELLRRLVSERGES